MAAVLPVYDGNVSIDPGLGTFRGAASDNQIGQAFGRLAAAGGDLASAMTTYDARIAARADAEKQKVDAINLGLASNYAQQQAALNAERVLSNTPQTGEGLVKSVNAEFDKVVDEFMQQVPEGERAKFKLNMEQTRTAMVQKYAGIEHKMRETSMDEALKGRRQLLMDMVTGGGDVKLAQQMADDFVGTMIPALGDQRAALVRQRFGEAIEAAAVQKWVKDNPVGAANEIQKRVAGTFTGAPNADPHVKDAISAAERHGIDPVLLLAIRQTEGKSNTNLAASKTIIGMYQMSQAEFDRVGLPRSTDPAIQNEAAARLLRANAQELAAHGLEPNFVNMKGMHWLGVGGWRAALRADPSMSMRDFYGAFVKDIDRVVATNGWQGKTVGDVIASVQKMEGWAKKQASDLVGTRAAPSNEPLNINGVEMKYITPELLSQFGPPANEARAKIFDAVMKDMFKKRVEIGEVLNGYDPHHRGEYNKLANAEGWGVQLLQGDPNAATRAVRTAQQNGFISSSEAAAVAKLSTSQDMATRVRAFEIGSTVHAADPVHGLENSGFDGETKRKIEQYNALRMIEKLPPEEIVRRMDRLADPTFKAKTDEMKQAIKDGKATVEYSDLANVTTPDGRKLDDRFFASWRSAKDGLYQDTKIDRLKEFLGAKLQEQFAYHMADLGSANTEAQRMAKTRALADVSRMIGTTKAFGKEELTLFPPDKYLAREKEDVSWIGDQAVLAARNAAARVKKETGDTSVSDLSAITKDTVRLMPTATTYEDIRAGRRPRYDLIYRDSAGYWNSAGQWTADPSARKIDEPRVQAAPPPPPQNAPGSGDTLKRLRNQEKAMQPTREAPQYDANGVAVN